MEDKKKNKKLREVIITSKNLDIMFEAKNLFKNII